MTDPIDKPLRGPSRTLGLAVDGLDYIKPNEVEKALRSGAMTLVPLGDVTSRDFGSPTVVNDEKTNAVIKPMRGHAAPLVYYDDKMFFSSGTEPLPFHGTIDNWNENFGILPGSVQNKAPTIQDLFQQWKNLMGKGDLEHIADQIRDPDFARNVSLWYDEVTKTIVGPDFIEVKLNYGRIPSKADGRPGTRRDWKRAHPPKTVRFDCKLDTSKEELLDPLDPLSVTIQYEQPNPTV